MSGSGQTTAEADADLQADYLEFRKKNPEGPDPEMEIQSYTLEGTLIEKDLPPGTANTLNEFKTKSTKSWEDLLRFTKYAITRGEQTYFYRFTVDATVPIDAESSE